MQVLVLVILCLSSVYGFTIIEAENWQKEALGVAKPYGAFDISGLVKGYGYPFAKHSVTTDDGYVLEIHRIQYSPQNSNVGSRPPVLIMHGLLGSSADFLHIGVGKSLPLRLADAGYDVWLGNNRGNTYARKHTSLNPDKNASFWDFSLHELGVHDAPAIIEYILKETKVEKLSFIGHDTGATQFFIMTSTLPEYNDKINIMVALAPTVYIGHASSILLRLIGTDTYAPVLALEQALNITTEFLNHGLVLDLALQFLCKNGSKLEEVCAGLLFFIAGFDDSQLDRAILPNFLKSFPAGASIKQINHFLQDRISGKFLQYNYGIIKNLEIYKSRTPPPYNLTKVSTPVGIFYGQNDLIVEKVDIDQLADELQNVVEVQVLEYKEFNHIDFLLAKDVDAFANYYIINLLNKYNNLPEESSTSSTASTMPTSPNTGKTTVHSTSTTQKGSSFINRPYLYVIVTNIFIVIFFYRNLFA